MYELIPCKVLNLIETSDIMMVGQRVLGLRTKKGFYSLILNSLVSNAVVVSFSQRNVGFTIARVVEVIPLSDH